MDESCETGVTAALEKIRVLESRLRQAIQNSHPLSTSFGSDPVAADRERDALLSVGEMLELLEDKLREYRMLTLNPREYDDRTVTLSQLDSLRRELIDTARTNMAFIIFGKDVIKDVLAFSEVAESGTPREGPLSPIEPPPLGQASSPPAHSPALAKAPWADAGQPRARRELKLHTAELDEDFGLYTPPSASRAALRASWPGADNTAAEADRIIHSAYRAGSESGAAPAPRSRTPMLSPRVVTDGELYQQTNGGSRYTFDPEYGGKIDVAARRGHDGGAAPPAASAPARGAPYRLRVREPFGSEAAPRPHTDARSDEDGSAASTSTWQPAGAGRRRAEAAPPPPAAAATAPRCAPAARRGDPRRAASAAGAGPLEAARRGVAALAVGALASVAFVGAMEVAQRVGHTGERRRDAGQRRRRAAAALEGGGGRLLPSIYPNPSPKAQRYAAPAAAEPPSGSLFPQQPPPVIASARA